MIKNLGKLAFLFTLLIQLTTASYSQKQSIIGIDATLESMPYNNIKLGAGLTFEKHFTLHSGIETGLFYRTKSVELVYINESANTNDRVYPKEFIENYISIPLLYKFYSNVVNVAAGPSLDYYVGWYDVSEKSDLKTISYSITPKAYYGLLIKIGKKINLGDNFLIEPEIRYSQYLKYYGYYAGIGVAAKYQF